MALKVKAKETLQKIGKYADTYRFVYVLIVPMFQCSNVPADFRE